MGTIHKERQIYALLDGRLSDGKREKLEQHLEQCEDCRRFMEEIRALRTDLRDIGSAQPEGVNWQGAWNLIEAGLERQGARAGRPAREAAAPFWKFAFAGAVVLLVAAVYVVVDKKLRDGRETAGTPEGAQVQPATPKGEIAAPVTALATFTTRNATWTLPGVGAKDLAIDTVLREGASITTTGASAVGIQAGSRTGIRLEAFSSVTLTHLTGEEVALRLERGTVSVDFASGEKTARVSVTTSEARVLARGTLFSVSKSSDATSVVVGKGEVLVTPTAKAQEAVSVKRAEGIRVSAAGAIAPIGETAEAETQRLETALFNMFGDQVPEEVLTVDVEGNGGFGFIGIDGKEEASAHLVLRRPAGDGEARVVMKDGSEIPLAFTLAQGKSASVACDLKTLAKLQPAETVKPKKTTGAPEEKILEEEEGTETEEAAGFIDPFLVKVKIMKAKGTMRSCYEKYLDSNPEERKIKARIVFTIGEDGKVTTSTCSCNVQNEALATCLSESVKAVTFPKPEGGAAEFEYPVSFNPQ
jgi:ferric-dicitrate binding protein FerR (iron transport regulator)